MPGGDSPRQDHFRHDGWTVDTLQAWVQSVLDEREKRYDQNLAALREALEQRFQAQQEALKQAIEASRTAVNKAELAVEKRLENTNEWRDAMNDRDTRLLPRAEYDRQHGDLIDRVETMRRTLEERTAANTARLDKSEGRGGGMHSGWIYLIGIIGIIGTITSIVVGIVVLTRK